MGNGGDFHHVCTPFELLQARQRTAPCTKVSPVRLMSSARGEISHIEFNMGKGKPTAARADANRVRILESRLHDFTVPGDEQNPLGLLARSRTIDCITDAFIPDATMRYPPATETIASTSAMSSPRSLASAPYTMELGALPQCIIYMGPVFHCTQARSPSRPAANTSQSAPWA